MKLISAIKWLSLRRSGSSGGLVADDACLLMESFANGAYDVARTRARQSRLGQVLDANRPAGHWDTVRREIARRTDRQVGVDTATRYMG